ncbi:MAG: hypothetical protein ACOX5T_05400 [Candidatus Cryptobacteroides sp.]|jgi:uncharacterized membrane protein
MQNPFKVIALDLGGVIFDQSHENAIRHFEEVGVREAARSGISIFCSASARWATDASCCPTQILSW